LIFSAAEIGKEGKIASNPNPNISNIFWLRLIIGFGNIKSN
jgi:hypothetical protein